MGFFFALVAIDMVSFQVSAMIDTLIGSSQWDKAMECSVHKFFLEVSSGDMV